MNNHSMSHTEEALLGCLLHDNAAFDEISHIVKPEDFSLKFHQDIFRVISGQISEGMKADVISVSETLKNELCETTDESFTKVCEIALSNCVVTNIKYYADAIKQNAIKRNLIKAAQSVIVGVNENKENCLEYAQQLFSNIADQVPSDISPASSVLAEVLSSIDERQKSQSYLTGLGTGFYDLDKLTHGFQKGDLIILAGRPSMGKTLLAMNVAEHVALIEKQPVIIFSLEMSKQQLIERSLVSVARLDASKVQSGSLNPEEFHKLSQSVPQFTEAKLFIDDQASINISEIRSICRRVKRENGLSLVIVDYIGLMSGEGENETIRVGNISRGLKLLARDLQVPVIAISQLNRSVEQRTDKRPGMADLRQSGAIEQDADLIMFVYRDEVYHKASSRKGFAEIIIAKHRNGATGTINLTFNGQHCRFDNAISVPVVESVTNQRWQGGAYAY